jgi:amidase
MTSFIKDFDVIICPTSARTALLPGQALTSEYKFVYYTSAYNVTGWPAGVVRVGTSDQGMPISIQVVGKPWQEHVVIAVMEFLEKSFGGWAPSPI